MFAPQREYLSKHLGAKVVNITLPGLVDISSTQLRELLSREKGSEYLLPAVYGYILMHRLYDTSVVLKELTLPQLRALFLLHDPRQAGAPCDGGGRGGCAPGQILGS